MNFSRLRKVSIISGRGTDRDSPGPPKTETVRQGDHDKDKDKQAIVPETDKPEQEVPDKGITGHVTKDSYSTGQVGTSEDRDLAGPTDIHTEKVRHAFTQNEEAGKKGCDSGKAGQSERDTLRDGQVDVYEEKTRRGNVDPVPEATGQWEKSGKREKMKLRRRSKIKVFLIFLFLSLHVYSSSLN